MKKTLVTAALAAASVLALNAPAVVGATGIGTDVNSIADFTIVAGDDNGNQGSLELITVPTLHFGSPKISAFLGGHAIKLESADPVWDDQAELTQTPGDIVVKDYSTANAATPSGNGWNLKAKMGVFTSTQNSVQIQGTIAMGFEDTNTSDNLENSMAATSQFPANNRPTLETDGELHTIVNAAQNTGRGTTAYKATSDLTFTPVANQNVVEGAYSSTVTWVLGSGPSA